MYLPITEDEKTLTVSLVIFKPNLIDLRKTLSALVETHVFKIHNCFLLIVDNSPTTDTHVISLINEYLDIMPGHYIARPDNPGFGVSHNLCLNIKSKYNLILNPDLVIHKNAMEKAFDFMNAHPECGLLAPYVMNEKGEMQYTCKRYPSLFIFFLRFFSSIKRRFIFNNYLRKYDMSDTLTANSIYFDPPIASGCFMFFRHSVLKELSGFNTKFFLYFEDFDISLRVRKISRIAYVPEVKVIHFGGHTARKSRMHLKLFLRSMITFFNIHGWKIW